LSFQFPLCGFIDEGRKVGDTIVAYAQENISVIYV